jgi:predicted amidohydrolase
VLAADAGATWILTPELVTTGYTFSDHIGTDWIAVQPDAWLHRICALARRHNVVVFLGHVERDETTNALHNSVFTIAQTGELLGRHRKINTLRIGSEAWSTPGVAATVVALPPYGKVGILICADAYSPTIAGRLQAQGADVLVSSAAWAPGLHGPDGEWERVTEQTGLPLFVCNRTGQGDLMSFMHAESVVAHRGRRLLSMTSARSKVFIVDWSLTEGRLRSPQPNALDVPPIEE